MTINRDEILRQMEDDRAAIERAREESRRITETLKRSRRVRRTVIPKLRRAGLVR